MAAANAPPPRLTWILCHGVQARALRFKDGTWWCLRCRKETNLRCVTD